MSRGNTKLARLRQLARNGKLKWKPSKKFKQLQEQPKDTSNEVVWSKFTNELPWNR